MIIRHCLVCQKEFSTYPSAIIHRGALYCSHACYGKGKAKPIRLTCTRCGQPFVSNQSEVTRGRRYCSRSCYLSLTGQERFAAALLCGPHERGCWIWMGKRHRSGYGEVFINGKGILCHRYAWKQTYGHIPHGLFVCHHCDTPSCVNPTHLFLGTARDNTQDRDRKERTAKGEKSGTAKLTSTQVLDMRALKGTVSNKKIAILFSIHLSTVEKILGRKTWKHI